MIPGIKEYRGNLVGDKGVKIAPYKPVGTDYNVTPESKLRAMTKAGIPGELVPRT